MDAITLLEREGVTVHFPENQTCCGQPAYTSGYPDEARAVALTQMQLFRMTGQSLYRPALAPA